MSPPEAVKQSVSLGCLPRSHWQRMTWEHYKLSSALDRGSSRRRIAAAVEAGAAARAKSDVVHATTCQCNHSSLHRQQQKIQPFYPFSVGIFSVSGSQSGPTNVSRTSARASCRPISPRPSYPCWLRPLLTAEAGASFRFEFRCHITTQVYHIRPRAGRADWAGGRRRPGPAHRVARLPRSSQALRNVCSSYGGCSTVKKVGGPLYSEIVMEYLPNATALPYINQSLGTKVL
jgi:hypothetical protein